MTKHSQSKAESKRAYLIEQAARCLAQKGYAHVSLRDIARESGVSLGILHYYFADKEELLSEVIRNYKNNFILRLEQELGDSASFLEVQKTSFTETDSLIERLLTILRHAFLEEKETHRLWYDFQVLAMYQPVFREHVVEIRQRFLQVIKRILFQLSKADTSSDEASAEALETLAAQLFAMLDGLFFQALLEETEHPDEAFARFEKALTGLVVPLIPRL